MANSNLLNKSLFLNTVLELFRIKSDLFSSSDFTQRECSAESTANDVGFTAQGTAKHRDEEQHAFAAAVLKEGPELVKFLRLF